MRPHTLMTGASTSVSDGRNKIASLPGFHDPPCSEPATHAEIGHAWHCCGHRRWAWFGRAGGSEPNGLIEFGAQNILWASFYDRWTAGSWWRLGGDDMEVAFGTKNHTAHLTWDEKPTFLVTRRSMRATGTPSSYERIKGVNLFNNSLRQENIEF